MQPFDLGLKGEDLWSRSAAERSTLLWSFFGLSSKCHCTIRAHKNPSRRLRSVRPVLHHPWIRSRFLKNCSQVQWVVHLICPTQVVTLLCHHLARMTMILLLSMLRSCLPVRLSSAYVVFNDEVTLTIPSLHSALSSQACVSPWSISKFTALTRSLD